MALCGDDVDDVDVDVDVDGVHVDAHDDHVDVAGGLAAGKHVGRSKWRRLSLISSLSPIRKNDIYDISPIRKNYIYNMSPIRKRSINIKSITKKETNKIYKMYNISPIRKPPQKHSFKNEKFLKQSLVLITICHNMITI